MSDLTPEQEALVDDVAADMRLAVPITRVDADTIARAIIPLIYTAGRRAGIEEIAAWIEPQRQRTPAHGWEFAAAIRNLSEESGRE